MIISCVFHIGRLNRTLKGGNHIFQYYWSTVVAQAKAGCEAFVHSIIFYCADDMHFQTLLSVNIM